MKHPSAGRQALTVTAALLAAVSSNAALACSTCKCGDYTITLLGSEKAYSGRFRTAVDHVYRSETAGAGAGEQKTIEQRTTLGLAYSLSEDITLALQLPFVRKEIEAGNLARQEAEGLGDVDVTARWTLHRSGAVSGRHLAGVRAGVRLPTSEEVEVDGELLDIDVQPDAGVTVPSLGAWYGYYRFPWFATATITAFKYGEGNQQFEGGDAVVASTLAQYGLTQTFALQFGVDARWSNRNRFSGVADPNSGGTLAMAFVGTALRIGEDFLVHAGAQLPLIEDLNGAQDEDPALRVGMTYDF